MKITLLPTCENLFQLLCTLFYFGSIYRDRLQFRNILENSALAVCKSVASLTNFQLNTLASSSKAILAIKNFKIKKTSNTFGTINQERASSSRSVLNEEKKSKPNSVAVLTQWSSRFDDLITWLDASNSLLRNSFRHGLDLFDEQAVQILFSLEFFPNLFDECRNERKLFTFHFDFSAFDHSFYVQLVSEVRTKLELKIFAMLTCSAV